MSKFVKRICSDKQLNVTLKEINILKILYLEFSSLLQQESLVDTETARWNRFKEIWMNNVKATQRKLCMMETKMTQFEIKLFSTLLAMKEQLMEKTVLPVK